MISFARAIILLGISSAKNVRDVQQHGVIEVEGTPLEEILGDHFGRQLIAFD